MVKQANKKTLQLLKELQPFDSIFIFWFILLRNISAEFLRDNNLLIACVLDNDTDFKDKVDLNELCMISDILKGNPS